MSWLRSGITMQTVGSWVKSAGKAVNGWFTDAGSWLEPTITDCQ